MERVLRIANETDNEPVCVGVRGISDAGVDLAFDRPVVLVEGEKGDLFWRVPWKTLGKAIIRYAGTYKKKPS